MVSLSTAFVHLYSQSRLIILKLHLSRTGEANVYTLGDLGAHRVVTTKLPMNSTATTSAGRDALIATGSSTTRLLGTFQRVEHVFLVGVGGAVPHYTDFGRHVRKGDVVVAAPRTDGDGDVAAESEGDAEKERK